MKEKYESPIAEIVKFDEDSIVATSGCQPGQNDYGYAFN